MKKSFFSTTFKVVALAVAFFYFQSCNKDHFTIENKDVSGDFTYTMTSFIPLSFDSTGTIPLLAQITMEGPGSISDLGDLYITSTFKFDFIAGHGTDFVTTYKGATASDTFQENGSSQVQLDGSIIVTDSITSGTGKFSQIAGGGTTVVWLNQAMDAGTGHVSWKVTY